MEILLTKSLNDKWLRVIGVPAFALLATVVFYNEQWLYGNQSFLKCFLIGLTHTFIFWYGNRYFVFILREKFPSIKQTRLRVLRQIFISTIFSTLVSLMISLINDNYLIWDRKYEVGDYIYDVLVVLIFVYTAIAIYELTYYFREWQASVQETERLKKAHLQSQFDSLKNQISPHFLFNSLNTLSSLIEDDQPKAVEFVNQLSRVYRYLLQSNEKELTTLQDELAFLNAYFFLLKKRFDNAITMNVDVSDVHLNMLIPPLTLQILVENAVKHNIVSVHKPLEIKVSVDDSEKLIVTNNLQKKTLHVASNGMGLANIAAKYKLLNQQEMLIDINHDFFKVSVPLIPC